MCLRLVSSPERSRKRVATVQKPRGKQSRSAGLEFKFQYTGVTTIIKLAKRSVKGSRSKAKDIPIKFLITSLDRVVGVHDTRSVRIQNIKLIAKLQTNHIQTKPKP